MSILINSETKVLIQGLGGNQANIHTGYMMEYGTKIVAGVNPGLKGKEVFGIPVFGSVKDAVSSMNAEWSCIFVPARFVKDASIEALEAGLNIVIITEGVPVFDTIEILKVAKEHKKIVVGPNCPGITTVGESKIGIMPNKTFSKKGMVGLVSRSGTLTYEVAQSLSNSGIGISTAVGIGGDPTPGLSFIDVLDMFEKDKETEKIVLLGEIGGSAEEEVAEYIKEKISKPVFAYIVGLKAPEGKQMGHAGAIISQGSGTAKSKIESLRKAGAKVANLPTEIPNLVLD